ncbi:hypothetical protein C8Q76DRAFT_441834 [Earliella scabrosa]|nr:hypothetical protein C8Q76DRAFT_441834 [Earliella scabrosa]
MLYVWLHPHPYLAHILPIIRDAPRRKKSQSTFTQREVDFPSQLDERDGRACIFTGYSARIREADRCHVFGHAKGEQMLAHIISTRCPTGVTEDGEDVTELSICTSANGFILKTVLHAAYDEFTGALLHTPNHVLQCDDLSQGVRVVRGDRRSLSGQRLSWFWLQDLRTNPDIGFDYQFAEYPQGMNAFFPPQSLTQRAIDENPLPSPFIVNYMFGVAAVRQWGVNATQIEQHPNHQPPPTTPTTPQPLPGLKPSIVSDRANTIRKREAARYRARPGTTLEVGAAEEPDAALDFDPYEVVLAAPFCVPGARERRDAWEESRRAAEAAAELQEQQRVEATVSQWMQNLEPEQVGSRPVSPSLLIPPSTTPFDSESTSTAPQHEER